MKPLIKRTPSDFKTISAFSSATNGTITVIRPKIRTHPKIVILPSQKSVLYLADC